MSQNIERFSCPSCKSTNVTLDVNNETITCNDCGYKYSTRSQYISQDVASSASNVAGTLIPKPLVKTEVIGYRRVTQEAFPHTHEEFKKMESDFKELQKSVEQLDRKVENLLGISPKIVVVEEIPKEEAKRKVEEYFREHKKADIEQLMLNLRIPVHVIIEVVDELKAEGKIAVEEEAKT